MHLGLAAAWASWSPPPERVLSARGGGLMSVPTDIQCCQELADTWTGPEPARKVDLEGPAAGPRHLDADARTRPLRFL
jgi:hypothetical protein